MSWGITLGLAALSFLGLAIVLKAPRKSWEAIGAVLLLGIAGFAWQARPAQPGAPKASAEGKRPDARALLAAQQQLASQSGMAPNSWMVISGAMARNGQFGDAAGIVLGAIEQDPKNSDAWQALANYLTMHSEGSLSPASLYAFRRAAEADPQSPGPPFFLGLALASNGKFDEGRALWADLLARTPGDAPWRADLAERLGRLDAFIATQRQSVAGPAASAPPPTR